MLDEEKADAVWLERRNESRLPSRRALRNEALEDRDKKNEERRLIRALNLDNPGYIKNEMKTPSQQVQANERISAMRKKLNDLQSQERDDWKERMANTHLKNKARWNKERSMKSTELQQEELDYWKAQLLEEEMRQDLTEAFQRLDKINATLDASLDTANEASLVTRLEKVEKEVSELYETTKDDRPTESSSSSWKEFAEERNLTRTQLRKSMRKHGECTDVNKQPTEKSFSPDLVTKIWMSEDEIMQRQMKQRGQKPCEKCLKPISVIDETGDKIGFCEDCNKEEKKRYHKKMMKSHLTQPTCYVLTAAGTKRTNQYSVLVVGIGLETFETNSPQPVKEYLECMSEHDRGKKGLLCTAQGGFRNRELKELVEQSIEKDYPT